MKRSHDYLTTNKPTSWVPTSTRVIRRIKRRKTNNDPDSPHEHHIMIEENLDDFLQEITKSSNNMFKKNTDVYSKDNHIYFQADVTTQSVEKLVELIDKQNSEYEELKNDKRIKRLDPNPIYLHITSFGGNLLMGFKAMDAIASSRVPIHTIIEGYAASCGSLMAVVGRKRYMTPMSFHLIHQLSGGAWGKFAEIEDDFLNCKRMMNKIVECYKNNTKMSKTEIEEQLKHDSWWTAEKCLEVGLIDKVWK